MTWGDWLVWGCLLAAMMLVALLIESSWRDLERQRGTRPSKKP